MNAEREPMERRCPFVIKVGDELEGLLEHLVRIGIARRIYPQMIDCTGIENERQVDTDATNLKS